MHVTNSYPCSLHSCGSIITKRNVQNTRRKHEALEASLAIRPEHSQQTIDIVYCLRLEFDPAPTTRPLSKYHIVIHRYTQKDFYRHVFVRFALSL